MKRKKRTAEQIVRILHEIDASVAQGSTVEKSCSEQGISNVTYYIWRNNYGRMQVYQVKPLRELEKENDRLKKIVAYLSLDKAILNEALKETTKPVPKGQGGRIRTKDHECFQETGM